MLIKTLEGMKKKERTKLVKALNNDIASIDQARSTRNPAIISEKLKDISYISRLVDTWNPAQLNEALQMLDLPIIDSWNPTIIDEQRRLIASYLVEKTVTGNPVTVNIIGNLTPEVTGLKVTMNPIQDLHGYEYPWAGGAGKNKVDLSQVTAIGSTVLVKNEESITITATSQYSGARTPKITIPEGTDSIFLYVGTNGKRVEFRQYDENDAVIGTVEGFGSSPVSNVSLVRSGAKTCDIIFSNITETGSAITFSNIMVAFSSIAIPYEPYENICPILGRDSVTVTRTAGEDVETKTHQYSETIYGGVDDFVNGGLSIEWGYIASYDEETLPGEWISDRDVYAPNTTPTTGAEVAYVLETPTTIETSAEEFTLLKGHNVISTDADSVEATYKQNF